MQSIISINALIMVSGLYHFIWTVITHSEKGSGQDGSLILSELRTIFLSSKTSVIRSLWQNIHKTNVVWNTRGTVTIVLYRRWSVNARSRSIDFAAKMTKETPVVVQPDRNWTIFNSQNTAKFSSSSAIYELHKVVDIPGRQGGQRPPGINGGEWSSWVFPLVKTIRKFPKHVTRENRQIDYMLQYLP